MKYEKSEIKKLKKVIKRPFKSIRSAEMSERAIIKLRDASRKDTYSVYAMMESSATGISNEEADDRILKFGLNEVGYDKAPDRKSVV